MASARKTGTNENISTYGNSTRDYTSLAAWEAATDYDLVSAAQSEVLECYDDAASFDDYVTLQDAVTSSSYFRIIRPASGQGHDGTPNNGVTFSCTTDADVISIYENYGQCQDIIGKLNIASPTSDRRVFVGYNATQVAFVGCIAVDSSDAGYSMMGFYLRPQVSGRYIFAIDCLAHNMQGDTGQGFSTASGSGDSDAYGVCHNCTSTDNDYGFKQYLQGLIVKNGCASGNASANWNGTISKITCTAEDANPTYKDAANDDFHLAESDTVCRGNGTDLSSDSNYAFDDDIDGETRSAWDIGFDEYSAAGLSINVFDSISTGEALIPTMPLGDILKYEGMSVSELRKLLIAIAPAVFESLSLSEVIQAVINISPGVFGNISVSEFIELILEVTGINTSEQITLSESVSTSLKLAGIDISENITISELTQTLLSILPDELDSISVSEFVNTYIELAGIDIPESVTLSEYINTQLESSGINVKELLVVTEVVNTILDVTGISRLDVLTVIENIILDLEIKITAYDIIGLVEYIRLDLPIEEYTYQSVSTMEYVKALLNLPVSKAEVLNISETVNALIEIISDLGIGTSQAITVAEYLQAMLSVAGISTYDSISLTEYVNVVTVLIVGKLRASFTGKKPNINFTGG